MKLYWIATLWLLVCLFFMYVHVQTKNEKQANVASNIAMILLFAASIMLALDM